MPIHRRDFLKSGMAAGLAAALPLGCAFVQTRRGKPRAVATADLEEVLARPVLRLDGLKDAVKIETIELFQFAAAGGNYFMVRVRSTDGAEGYAVPNDHAKFLHPIFNQQVAPFFIGKDARDLESLLEGVYLYKGNYKMQSLALWCPVAWVEFALLDLLGRMTNKPLGALIGNVIRDRAPMYVASGNRGTTPKEEVDVLVRRLAETGCRAVKFKVGGRMSHNEDSMPGRTEELIRLARKTLGPNVTIHADANGSYDPPRAIEIGRMLEKIDAFMFEEPCPFDHLEDTKTVADALGINVAGGEQESSERRFRWMIANNAVQIAQPDLHYYGGFIRTTRVARMAALAGMLITPHLSSGLGYSQLVHFASCTPNIGPYMEFKGDVRQTGGWFDPPIVFHDGALSVPTAPGFGMVAAPELLKKAAKIA
jgi:L-alanine-DL-glutamate epimerase-like enolase superfamily enzyme